jgi:hypothetical protein
MATILNLSIDSKRFSKNDLKNGQYLNVTIAINDETNQYGQNVSAWLAQSKEERDEEAERVYVGNGKTLWTDGKISVEGKDDKKKAPAKKKPVKKDEDDLPW